MRWKTTWLLLGLAFVLFAFIVLVERRWKATSEGGERPERLLSLRAAEVTNIQIRMTNQLWLMAERARPDAPWQLTLPIEYPAQTLPVEWLAQMLEVVTPITHISPGELSANKRTLAHYGLEVPRATVTLLHKGQRTELMFGAKTAVGDQGYVQVQGRPGVFVITSELMDRLPRSPNEWRDTALVNLASVGFNRLEVRGAGRDFALKFDPTNKFYLAKPTVARADQAKVDTLLRQLRDATVQEFVADRPRPDLDQYGLQPPVLELVLSLDTNDLVVVQFGRSPTNDASLVYARRMSHTNIVLVHKALLDALQVSYSELRDLRLVNVTSAAAVDAIEVVGSEKVVGSESFTVRRQTNETWVVGGTTPTAADPELVRDWLNVLTKLEGSVEKDIVTDFTTYDLNPPARQYLLKSAVTNSVGSVSNRVIAELMLGAVQGDKVFARRSDEPTVYGLAVKDVARLPRESWQLRDRRVWSFTTNQIARVTVRYRGETRELTRSASGTWSIASGSGIMIDSRRMDTRRMDLVMEPLGELHASVWVARGDENRGTYGFKENSDAVTFELRNGDKPRTLKLELGGRAPNNLPYALSQVDGQTWIFEVPMMTFLELVRDLLNPLFPQATQPGK